ncbi:MAG: hypothetical protein R3E58_09000 [Phycisphaerae bacterium]
MCARSAGSPRTNFVDHPGQPTDASHGRIEVGSLVDALLKERIDLGFHLDGDVIVNVAAGCVRADVDQIFDIVPDRQDAPDIAGGNLMCSGETTSFITRLMLSTVEIADRVPAVGESRDSQTCPSSVPRTASLIGSLTSSPSTSTV